MESVNLSECRQRDADPAGTMPAQKIKKKFKKVRYKGAGVQLITCPTPFVIDHFYVTFYIVSLTVGSNHPFE